MHVIGENKECTGVRDRAAMQGELTVKAQALKLGGSFSTGEAQVYDEKGKLLASGRGVYFSAPPK